MDTVSIIIPVRPNGYAVALEQLMKIMPGDLHYEVLLAEGNAPSRQRNMAARESSGDILYFIDDDSLLTPDNLAICVNEMDDPKVAVVGGPSITPADDNWLRQLFGHALASKFGSGPVCNRYKVHGKTRKTTDKELILCNLAVRRSLFLELDGFNECLYPNEENEFLDRVTSAGHTLLHVPSMLVFRSQRPTLKAFIRQMFNYGRGRGQQTLITSSFSPASFIPLLFLIYLILLLICLKYVLLFVPLAAYLSIALVSTFCVLRSTRRLSALLLLCIYPLMHIVNGAGLFWGLINGTPKPVSDNSIKIRRMKRIGESFSDLLSSTTLP